MTDYIRKAVELADGWRLLTDFHYAAPRHDTNTCGVAIENTPQYDLDALAAQLVRQVDLLPEEYGVSVYASGTVEENTGDIYDEKKGYARAVGPDRTMNTIKAILDSKVLE